MSETLPLCFECGAPLVTICLQCNPALWGKDAEIARLLARVEELERLLRTANPWLRRAPRDSAMASLADSIDRALTGTGKEPEDGD